MYTKHNLSTDIVNLFDVLTRMKKLRGMTTAIVLVYMGWNTGIL